MNVVIPQSATARTCAPAARPLAVAARRVLVVMVQVWRVLMLVLFWIVAVRMGVLTDENWIVRVAVMPIVMSMEVIVLDGLVPMSMWSTASRPTSARCPVFVAVLVLNSCGVKYPSELCGRTSL